MTTPACTLMVQIFDDGNWNFAYTSAATGTTRLGQWALPLANLTMLAIQNEATIIPTADEHQANAEAQIAAAAAADAAAAAATTVNAVEE